MQDKDLQILLNEFPVRIYTRHDNMNSCIKVESLCGQIDVVKNSSTVTVDKRLFAYSPWDHLFGTNRTETTIANAPIKQSKYQRELIQSMSPGTCIIDSAGEKSLFTF